MLLEGASSKNLAAAGTPAGSASSAAGGALLTGASLGPPRRRRRTSVPLGAAAPPVQTGTSSRPASQSRRLYCPALVGATPPTRCVPRPPCLAGSEPEWREFGARFSLPEALFDGILW